MDFKSKYGKTIAINMLRFGDLKVYLTLDHGSDAILSASEARAMGEELLRIADEIDPQPAPSADKGKGSYVAYVQGDDIYGQGPRLSLIVGSGKEPMTDFQEALDYMQTAVSEGNLTSAEVVELTVARRGIVKRAVEVSVA